MNDNSFDITKKIIAKLLIKQKKKMLHLKQITNLVNSFFIVNYFDETKETFLFFFKKLYFLLRIV